jgi:quercetin dioxygenase-like cupin family protein
MNSPGRLRTAVICALAVVIGIAIGAAGMHLLQARHPGVNAARLLQADLTGVAGKEVFMSVIEVQPGAEVAPHLHHGDEFVYVIEGSYERFVEQVQSVANAGDVFHVEREKVHGGKAVGAVAAKLLTIHVVDKGKPLTEGAKR